MIWRDLVDPTIKAHLEKQVAESIKDRGAYEAAQNPGNAQLWVVVANLSKEMFDLNLKLKFLEGTMREFAGKNETKKKKAKTKQ